MAYPCSTIAIDFYRCREKERRGAFATSSPVGRDDVPGSAERLVDDGKLLQAGSGRRGFTLDHGNDGVGLQQAKLL